MSAFFYFCKMKNITIIGSGNVAFHLTKAFSDKNHLVDVFARRKDQQLGKLANNYDDLSLLRTLKDQFVLICVSDDSIISILEQLDDSNRIAYTSATFSIENAPRKQNIGVFYPLQSFSKERDLNYVEIPFLIEANNEGFAQELFDLAWELSNNVHFANSSDRKQLHLAAVFANNFTNHLYSIAKNHLDKYQIDWKLLLPLIQETSKKIGEMDPNEAQTGPAKRDDKQTIHRHLEQLDIAEREIYLQITNHILTTFAHEKL